MLENDHSTNCTTTPNNSSRILLAVHTFTNLPQGLTIIIEALLNKIGFI